MSSLEVTHLVETGTGGEPAVEAVVVANDSDGTEGTIDAQTAVAEFEVDCFSNFTITWTPSSGASSTSVTVYVYNQNGLGIYDNVDSFSYTGDSISVESLVSNYAAGGIAGSYHFEYATAQYLTSSGTGNGGGTLTTIGSFADPVTQVAWNGTSYVVTTGSENTTVTKSSTVATEFYINLYFAVPTVTIALSGVDTATGEVTLTAEATHFQSGTITYIWSLAEGDEAYAAVAGSGAEAAVNWTEDDPAGTAVTVIVTAVSDTGETAVGTYELTYGMEQVTYTVYYPGGNNGSYIAVGAGADVALKDEHGHVVSEGTTDASGQVTLWVVAGETYTLEASYTVSSSTGSGGGPGSASSTHYTHEDTAYSYNAGDETRIELDTVNTNSYEHVDVKLSIADPEDAGFTDILAMVDYVKIYNEEGTEIYTNSQMVHNSGTNDYNVIFTDNSTGSSSHSIVFYDTYSIEIACEVTYIYLDSSGQELSYTETYVATINKDTTYVDDEYYHYSGTNAYQLYNELYGTGYTEEQFNALVESEELPDYNPNGIHIGGRTFFEVAVALCDSYGVSGMAGLDLALGVNSLIRVSSTTWNFKIQKTLNNAAMTDGEFRFLLYTAHVDENAVWSVNASGDADDDFEKYVTNSAAEPEDGKSVDVADGSYSFDVTSEQVGVPSSYYFVLFEQADTAQDGNIAYDGTVYGIRVDVTLNSSTDLTNVTITSTPFVLTQAGASDPQDGYLYYTGEETTLSEDGDGVVIYPFENTFQLASTYILVQKQYNKEAFPTGDDAFAFTIEALSADLGNGTVLKASEMPMPSETTVTVESGDAAGYFGPITCGEAGTYYYKITEEQGSLSYVEYDSSVHYVKIVVAADEGTHEVTADEYEARAGAETDDYRDLDYDGSGIVTAVFTNTAYEELRIEKEVTGDAGDTSAYEFEITLTNSDGTPFEGTVSMTGADGEDTLPFADGRVAVTITAGEKVTIMVPSGATCTITEKTTGADSTTVYDGSGSVIVQAKGTETEAAAEIGTIADSTQVRFVNSFRAYFPIDEEIVTDPDDLFNASGESWVKDEAVNEYNAIEIEMTTNLPVVTAYDLANGAFTMNFHEVLDHELVLDEEVADFSVYIAGYSISPMYYSISFDEDTGDDCNFHVDVDLSALFNDGIVTGDMLDGGTEITIFFFVDLEGTDLNGSYRSTIWYDIYDGDEGLYTSNVSVVEVYTYEIKIIKYDASTLEGDDYEGSGLAGATLGVYKDEDCADPVIRSGEPYTAASDGEGTVMFYGLADGTYYVTETEAPDGYELSDEVLGVVLGEELLDSGHMFEGVYANTPLGDEPEPGPDPDPEPQPGPGPEIGNPEPQTGPGPEIGNPEPQTGPSPVIDNPDPESPVPTAKTSDPGLPMRPLAGCCAAAALIAAALVIRRRRAD